jgi:molybdopterin/thiamine biosynthesis adenylyltransferase/nitroreductase
MREEAGRRARNGLLDDPETALDIHDTILLQLRDLMQSRHPARKLTAAELDSLTGEHLRGVAPGEYGVWAYYPWSRRLVHLLEEEEFAELRTNRNRYKITPAEQSGLASKKIGIVGLSVGQSVAAVLALERSFGELRLADFDTLDLSNLNRIRAGVHSLGIPKVCVTAREIAEIDPFLKVTPFFEGIGASNVDAFLLEGGKLDVVVEECDSIDVKILVRHRARVHGIPVVMDTSDRGMLDIERFDREPQRPLFHGLAGDLDAEQLGSLTTEQKVPYVLRILGVQTLSPRMRASMLEVGGSIYTWPQLGSAVALGGAAAADVVRRIVLGQMDHSGRFFLDPDSIGEPRVDTPEPVPAPRHAPAEQVWKEFVSAAILAPSGGNIQPWQWTASASGPLDLYLDQARTSGLIDFEHGGSYLALGCAAENVVLAAHAAGYEIELNPFPSHGNQCHAASFRLLPSSSKGGEGHRHDYLHAQVPLRHTQRNLGKRHPVPAADLEELSAAVRSVGGADIQWHTDEAILEEVARLVGAADRIRILNRVLHAEMLREVRWTASEADTQRDGIDIETLGLSPTDRAGFELCRDWSALELISAIDGGRNLEKMAAKQMNDAAAVGLVAVDGSGAAAYFRGGRAVQRMWLTAARMGIAVHPMTALIYFFARLVRGGGQGFSQGTIAELEQLRSRFGTVFQLMPSAAEVLLFRIGFADGAMKRSLRRPITEVFRSR